MTFVLAFALACISYTVQAGDSLAKIAKANNTTYIALAQLNGLDNPNLIGVGQVICLSGNSTPVTPVPVIHNTYNRPAVTVAQGLEGYADLLNSIVDAAFRKCPDLIGELVEVRLDSVGPRIWYVGWTYGSDRVAHLIYLLNDYPYMIGVIAHEAAHARQFRLNSFGADIETDAMIIASTCR